MKENESKFIIDVAVLTRIPLSRQQFFSYVYHEPIPAGSLVSVPLFRRTIQGVVLQSRSDFHRLGNFKLRRVQTVLETEFLNEKQLQLARWMSEYYLSSLGIVLKQFIPKRVSARVKQTKRDEWTASEEVKKIKLTSNQESAVSVLTKKYQASDIKHPTFLLQGPSASGKTEVYFEAIERILKNDHQSQHLILVPELTLAADIINRASKRFGKNSLAVLHSSVSDGSFYRDWERIRCGEASIIIGTRMAVFAPFNKLSLVIVDEEQDISYKQWDMNPRYDGRTAAKNLASLHGASLVLCSATARIETLHRTHTGEYISIELPKLNISGFEGGNISVEVVDMRKERWKDFSGKKRPNYSCISRLLESELHFILSHRKQAILFVNHQGMNSFTICSDCKEVLRCPQCQRTLVYDQDGTYHCLHCRYVSGVFPTCAKCGSMKFNNIGVGTQTVEKEIKKRFPSARIARVDRKTMKNNKDQEKLFQDFLCKKFDIIIGTQMITKGWDMPNVDLVGIIDADSLMSIPDFATEERALQHLIQASGRTGRPGSTAKGKVIIQTFDPNNDVIQAAAEMKYATFCEKELEQRKALKYPPFGKFIRLVCQNSDATLLEKESAATYNRITEVIAGFDDLRALGPVFPLVSKVRSKYRKQILISIKKADTEIPGALLSVIHKLGSDWIIDVDPINII